jgi:protein tyrosine/serine phosphatase
VTIEHAARRLDWPGCCNVRDLGGLPTADGGRIRAGAVVRSDALAGPDFGGHDVSRIIDLRSADEAAKYPSPVAGDPRYLLAPYGDPVRDAERDPIAERTLVATYLGGLERNAGRIVTALTAIAEAPAGTVVVHCFAGKDRTGVIVALALRVAGVADDVIAADYGYTAECLRDRHEAALAACADEDARNELRDQQRSDPATILAVLRRIDDDYGDVPAYLRSHGMPAETLSRLRSRLTDSS